MTNDKQPSDDLDRWDGKYPERDPDYSEFREEDEPKKKQFPYDLEENTARFGEAIIRFAKKIPNTPVNRRLIEQLVGCGTGVRANYCEADDAVSKKEFTCKIAISRKEARETKFFLRMVATAEPSLKEEARELWFEAKSLHLIFCRIFRTGRK